ncbi:hypothetical protein EDD16DRAFT_1527929 [Pisolithus croceorrhizus]|nr:hypothetical protein EDD16DRAFT_1527929 [Pisolithus croceorrhizus]
MTYKCSPHFQVKKIHMMMSGSNCCSDTDQFAGINTIFMVHVRDDEVELDEETRKQECSIGILTEPDFCDATTWNMSCLPAKKTRDFISNSGLILLVSAVLYAVH